MEIIFVDDGSTDDTLSIIKRYSKQIDIITKIFSQKWKGLGSARNVVVNNSQGDYIVWIDSDMLISKDYINKLVNFMENNLNAGIAKGRHYIYTDLNWISELEIYTHLEIVIDYDADISKTMGTGGAFYRVKAIKDVGGFDENIRGSGEDWNAENKIRKSGWKLYIVNSTYADHERLVLTWGILWQKYYKRGYDHHKFQHINKEMIVHYKMLPIAALLGGFILSLKIYKITGRKVSFLLPIPYLFKSFAWWYGFIQAYTS
jgi:glycosyltransferase involved in cell wall biosynthesis